ncbi:hypothetical protein [Pseudoxanthomonas sp. z9]|uniref:hypothetical protein n=1 Tax=Pseudoxanthomonas sp. z9 TaxID=2584942 RepID=UPI0011445E36|nr:hypothetical protein [Pseudoxanthomonas sp. z9]
MKAIAPLLLSLLASGGALAQSAESLDLTLPRPALYSADPPGTYYGDTSGRPARALRPAPVARNACGTPVDEDDGKVDVSGSVATGIGYTKGYGSSHWNAANINLCKSYNNDEGESRAFNLNIGVSRYDGPGFHGYRRLPGDVGPPPPRGFGGTPMRP